MPLNSVLARNIDVTGTPSKKQKLLSNTPLKHFLRPIIEEAMLRNVRMMQQAQQMPQRTSPSPLETALGNKEMV